MSEDHSPEIRLAARISRHATIYAFASVGGVLAGLLSVIVYTRYLRPAEFGRFAVLSTIASLVTVVANMAILPGTMRRVYGTTGDEDDGEDIDDEESRELAGDIRLTVTTGFVLTAAVGAVMLLAAWFWRESLASLLVGDSKDGNLLVLSTTAGVTASGMRLGRNFVRMQRRPLAYVAISMVSTVGGTLAAIPLLAKGDGLEGILIGFTAANILSLLITLVLLRTEMRAAFSFAEGAAIVSSSAYYIPIIFSIQTIQAADTLLVARFRASRMRGLYRVAQRTATPVTYGTSVFLQSWAPLKPDLLHVAADQRGEKLLTSRLVTHYAVFVSALVLAVAILADQLVHIAAPEYSTAAALVPLTTLSVAGHGWFVMAYRVSSDQRKRLWFLAMSLIAAVVFVGTAALLIPPLGAIGAPIAGITAWGLATGVLFVTDRLQGTAKVPFEYGRLATIGVTVLVAWGVGYWVLPDSFLGVVGKFLVLGAWVVALVLLDVVPLEDLRQFGRFMRFRAKVESSRHVREQAAQLNVVDRDLVDRVARRKVPVPTVAEETGLSEEEILVKTVQALRSTLGGGKATIYDGALGQLLFMPRSRTERDIALRALVDDGLDPVDADQLLRAQAAVGARRRWRR